MAVESTAAARWDDLHRDPRHQLRYPSEHVVRWLAGLPINEGKALDIGCGSGRHTDLMTDFGFSTVAVDSSASAIAANSYLGDMRALPFCEGLFDIALAYGVFYYGTRDDMQVAISEMYRVLRPGGHGFVKTRTVHDWRASGIPEGEPEHGMEMTFLAKDDIPRVYAAFGTLTFETTATSFRQGERWDSDWLISVQK